MSTWSKVGDWLKENAGAGTALVGSLLTGNVPGAVAAGTALVASATGTDDPSGALAELQSNPESVVRLKELYYENEEAVRSHLESMKRLELEDRQKEHQETQKTVRAGDGAEDVVVKRTRPLQSWLSLFAGIVYIFYKESPDLAITVTLFTLPWTYAGLRQVGKGIESLAKVKRK